jgi:hypothetical protein
MSFRIHNQINYIAQRENAWMAANHCKDADGQAHFPDYKLGLGEVTPCNPWTMRKIPLKPIKRMEKV